MFNIADNGLVGSPASQTEVSVFDDLGFRLNIVQITPVNPWYAVQQKQLYLCQSSYVNGTAEDLARKLDPAINHRLSSYNTTLALHSFTKGYL